MGIRNISLGSFGVYYASRFLLFCCLPPPLAGCARARYFVFSDSEGVDLWKHVCTKYIILSCYFGFRRRDFDEIPLLCARVVCPTTGLSGGQATCHFFRFAWWWLWPALASNSNFCVRFFQWWKAS